MEYSAVRLKQADTDFDSCLPSIQGDLGRKIDNRVSIKKQNSLKNTISFLFRI